MGGYNVEKEREYYISEILKMLNNISTDSIKYFYSFMKNILKKWG